MKQENVSRMNRLLEETEAFLNERGATLLNGGITLAPNDYTDVGAEVRIDLMRYTK